MSGFMGGLPPWTDVAGAISGSPATYKVFWPAGATEVEIFVKGVTQSGSGLLAMRLSTDGQNFLNGGTEITIVNPDGTETPTSAMAAFSSATTLGRSFRVCIRPNNGAGPKGIYMPSRPLEARFDFNTLPIQGAEVYSTSGGNVAGGSVTARYR